MHRLILALCLSTSSVALAQDNATTPPPPSEPARVSVTAGQRHLMAAYRISANEAEQRIALEGEVTALAKTLAGSVANIGDGRAASPRLGIRQHWQNAD